MATALVLGVNGQDGSYLAECLLGRGHAVIGVGRQPSSRWVEAPRFRYVSLDIADAAALDVLVAAAMPNEIYHLAAVHGPAGHQYETAWRSALAVNLGALHVCLEHTRTRAGGTRLFYASSLKAFGDHPPSVIDEVAPHVSDCLYGITKNAAFDLIRHYRARHGVCGSVGYFFNHDSPRRPETYFLPRLAAWLAGQVRGKPAPAPVSLDFWCDWGSSREFMSLAADLLQRDEPADLVFATGRPVHAADLAGQLAQGLGLTPPANAATGEPPFRADVGRMRAVLGRSPREGAADVARWILSECHGLVLAETDAAA